MHKFLIDATLCALQSRQRAKDLLAPLVGDRQGPGGGALGGGEEKEEEKEKEETLLLEMLPRSRRRGPTNIEEHMQGILAKIRKSQTVRIKRSPRPMVTESSLFSQTDPLNMTELSVIDGSTMDALSLQESAFKGATRAMPPERLLCSPMTNRARRSAGMVEISTEGCAESDSLELDCTSLDG